MHQRALCPLLTCDTRAGRTCTCLRRYRLTSPDTAADPVGLMIERNAGNHGPPGSRNLELFAKAAVASAPSSWTFMGVPASSQALHTTPSCAGGSSQMARTDCPSLP